MLIDTQKIFFALVNVIIQRIQVRLTDFSLNLILI